MYKEYTNRITMAQEYLTGEGKGWHSIPQTKKFIRGWLGDNGGWEQYGNFGGTQDYEYFIFWCQLHMPVLLARHME